MTEGKGIEDIIEGAMKKQMNTPEWREAYMKAAEKRRKFLENKEKEKDKRRYRRLILEEEGGNSAKPYLPNQLRSKLHKESHHISSGIDRAIINQLPKRAELANSNRDW